MAQPILLKQTFNEAKNEVTPPNPRSGVGSRVTLLGLVQGESSLPLVPSHVKAAYEEKGVTCSNLAAANLRKQAIELGATHVFGVDYKLHSTNERAFVIAYGDAYKIE